MFISAMQLKSWIKNKSKQTGTHANELLQNYMLERFLERVSLSPYRENLILKGGFLIAAMVGVDRRSTMDMDTTVKGLSVSREGIKSILYEIITIDVGDGVSFEIKDVKNIHDVSEYDDYRIGLLAVFQTLRVNMSIDITTGDAIIPREIEYHYKLMFEDIFRSRGMYQSNQESNIATAERRGEIRGEQKKASAIARNFLGMNVHLTKLLQQLV